MTNANTALVSHAPALSDAFSPEDLPAHLSYSSDGGGALSLTDADEQPVGDPVREFVADVLQSVDDSTDALRLLAAEAHIRPRPDCGHGIDLATLRRTFFDMRAVGPFFTTLMQRQIRVDIQISTFNKPDGVEQVQAWPKVALCATDLWPSVELERALGGYANAVAKLTREAIDGDLGAWVIDSGITHLVFGGQFKMPTPVNMNLGDEPYPHVRNGNTGWAFRGGAGSSSRNN